MAAFASTNESLQQRPYEQKSLKHLLFCPLQKRFADPCPVALVSIEKLNILGSQLIRNLTVMWPELEHHKRKSSYRYFVSKTQKMSNTCHKNMTDASC